MHRLRLLLADLGLIAVASVAAIALRDNLVVSQARIELLAPYLGCTLAISAVVMGLFGTYRSIWRFSSMSDYLVLVCCTLVIVIGAVTLGFGVNRLQNLPRSLPFLQGLTILTSLVGARVLLRLRHAARSRPVQLMVEHPAMTGESVLIVGLSRLTELYFQAAQEMAPRSLRIAGILGRSERHAGRFMSGIAVLGTPEQIHGILREQEVHGTQVDRILVMTAFDELSLQAQTALLDIERTTTIRLDLIAERLGLQAPTSRTGSSSPAAGKNASDMAFSVAALGVDELARKNYWRVKRLWDVGLAGTLLVVMSPIVAAVAVLVACDVGLPLTFWQMRPGLAGRPFKLYKLRTMANAHDARGDRIADSDRLSAFGNVLRQFRLDELPQLVNILTGEMSFVGPRPLLPADQHADYAARLLVRPGLTGWAQVIGGRQISALDKAALDIWYVHRASFGLDMQILLRTVAVLAFGERTNPRAISNTWDDLRNAGIVKTLAPHSGSLPSEPPAAFDGPRFAA